MKHTSPSDFDTPKWYSAFFRRGHLLVLSIVIVLVAGLSAIQNLPRLEDPRIDLRNVIVLTSYPGASAERVEALVSDVLEDEIRQLFEVKEVKSTSKAGFSSVFVELQDWTDNSNNQQIFSKIRDAIDDAAKRFPVGANAPILEDKRGATAFTVLYALTPKNDQVMSLAQTGRMAEEFADQLRNVSGTEIVRIYGKPTEEIQVEIDPQQLAAAGLTLNDITTRVQSADSKLPAGIMNTAQRDYRVQVSDPLESVDVVANIPVRGANGEYLRVGDIANVERKILTPEREIAVLNGQRSIFVAARMQTTVRVDQWTSAIDDKAARYNQAYGATIEAERIFEQNRYTEARLNELSSNLLLGSLVVMLVVLFFMGIRASLIVGLALPLCAAFTIFSLSFFNQQIHQMSIFGIIIAIGLLIDNAIVITDEIRGNLQTTDLSRLAVLQKSIRHLFSPLLASTLTTILGFMPIFLLNGNIGDFIGPIAISVVMALIGSLAISLTLIAALAARYLPRDNEAHHAWYQRGYQWPEISAVFRSFLTSAVQKPLLVLPSIVLFCVFGFYLVTKLDNVFFPSADRDQFELYAYTPSGSSVPFTYSKAMEVDEYLRDKSGIKQVTWLIGGSTPSVYYNQVMNKDNSPDLANAVITATSVSEAGALVSELQFELQNAFPELKIIVRQFGQGPPIDSPIEVDIFGPDLEVLAELGAQVRLAMTKVPGLTQSLASIEMSDSEFQIDIDENQSLLNQLALTSISRQLQQGLSGVTNGSVLEGTEEVPVRVRLLPEYRQSMQAVDALPLLQNNPGAGDVSVSGVGAYGDMRIESTISKITRIDTERVNKVQAYLLPGVAAVSASNKLREILDNGGIELPPGYRIKMAGDADEQQQALGQLATYAPVLLVMMLTSLILSFTSVRFATVIGIVALLSVGLGFFSLWLSGLPLGFNPLLGSAGLIGVAINGSIVIIAAIASNPKAMAGDAVEVVSETMGCSRHILSTTFTTVGGLLPLLLFSEGSFWPPLAVVLAGGVGFSVILSLLFTPTIVLTLCRLREKRRQLVHNFKQSKA